jgi:hypothetical protein
MQDAEANDAGGQGGPGILDDAQAVVADAQAAQPLEPANGPLHHPADLPQPAAMRCLPLGDVRLVSPSRRPGGQRTALASPGGPGYSPRPPRVALGLLSVLPAGVMPHRKSPPRPVPCPRCRPSYPASHGSSRATCHPSAVPPPALHRRVVPRLPDTTKWPGSAWKPDTDTQVSHFGYLSTGSIIAYLHVLADRRKIAVCARPANSGRKPEVVRAIVYRVNNLRPRWRVRNGYAPRLRTQAVQEVTGSQ